MNFSNQIDLINEIMPIRFQPDEFRLDKSNQDKNMKKHLDEIDTPKLLEIYFDIHMNYRNKFKDEKNEALYYMYEYIKKTLENRGEDRDTYVYNRRKSIFRVNVLMIIGCFVYYFMTYKMLYVSKIVFIVVVLLQLFWASIRVKLVKYNMSKIAISYVKSILRYLLICSAVAIVYNFRNGNNLLFLSGTYLILILLQLYYIKGMNKYGRKIKNKIFKKALTIYMYALLGIIIFKSFPTFIDASDNVLHTSAFIEGVCTSIEQCKNNKDYYYVCINDIELIVNKNKINNKKSNDTFEIGNFYVVRYGELTKAIASIEKRDVLNKRK